MHTTISYYFTQTVYLNRTETCMHNNCTGLHLFHAWRSTKNDQNRSVNLRLLKQCTVVNSEKLPFNQKIFMYFFKKLWKLSEPECFDQTRPE